MFEMPKISLLIFSINEVSEVISLAREMYRFVDEIVVIDSSDRKNMIRLNIKRRKAKLDKMRIFHAPALGYAEPYREYGISKCKNDWILLLDTDEKLSITLKNNLNKLVEYADFSILKIKRYEHVSPNGTVSSYYTWQARLFRKGSVEFLGLTHETPKMVGRVERLNSESEYISHLDELRHTRFYNKMDLFSLNGPVLLIIRDFMIGLMNGEMSIQYVTSTFKTHLNYENERMKDKSLNKIGKIIRKRGIIKYLQLDSDSVISKLNKKYSNKKQGIDLLIKLLKDKYDNKYP